MRVANVNGRLFCNEMSVSFWSSGNVEVLAFCNPDDSSTDATAPVRVIPDARVIGPFGLGSDLKVFLLLSISDDSRFFWSEAYV